MFSICSGAFNRSPPNGTILWKLYDGNIVFNLWLLSGKLWYYGMVSYYSFKAMVPGAPMSILAPQAFLGQCEQGERRHRKAEEGGGNANPQWFQASLVGKCNSVEAKSDKRTQAMLEAISQVSLVLERATMVEALVSLPFLLYSPNA